MSAKTQFLDRYELFTEEAYTDKEFESSLKNAKVSRNQVSIALLTRRLFKLQRELSL